MDNLHQIPVTKAHSVAIFYLNTERPPRRSPSPPFYDALDDLSSEVSAPGPRPLPRPASTISAPTTIGRQTQTEDLPLAQVRPMTPMGVVQQSSPTVNLVDPYSYEGDIYYDPYPPQSNVNHVSPQPLPPRVNSRPRYLEHIRRNRMRLMAQLRPANYN